MPERPGRCFAQKVPDTFFPHDLTEMPKLFAAAQDGNISAAEAKEWLNGLKDKAIKIAVEDLGSQGIDLASEFGLDWAEGKVRSFVDDNSPFLGPTVEALFDKGGDLISDQGHKYLGILSKKLTGSPTEA